MENQRFFDQLIDQTPDVFCILRDRGRIFYCGANSRKIFGYEPESVIGASALRFIHPAERQQARLRHAVLLAYPGNRVSADYRVRDAHGEYRWMECIFNNMINLPQINGILVQLRDISERKKFELQLEESEERFRIFMNNAPTVAWIKDEAGRHVFVNSNFERYFRIAPRDAIGKTLYDLFPESASREMEENDRLVLSYGKSIEFYERAPSADGKMREWIVHKFPVPQSNGKTYIGGSAMDITKWVELERERNQTDRKFRAVFEQSPDPVFIEDENGVIIDANRKACELQQLSYEQLIGKRITDLAPPERHASLMEDFGKLWNGELDRLDSHSWDASGRIIPVAINAARIQHRDESCMLLSLRER